jgi:hypothetical protein
VKRRFFFINSLLLFSFLFGVNPTRANTVITLSDISHRNANGVFIDDALTKAILPKGKLGKLIFDRSSDAKTWIIDVALIEEILDLADGYTFIDDDGNEATAEPFVVADIFLNTLRSATRNSNVFALPYGNPSVTFLRKSSPDELELYRSLGDTRLAAFLGRPVSRYEVESVIDEEPAVATANLYTSLQQSLLVTNSIVTSSEVETVRLRLAQLLNPSLDRERSLELNRSFATFVTKMNQRIRISGGNYTITSAQYQLPVTVINEFDQQVTLDLRVWASNSRVIVGKIPRITVAASSQLQIEVPLEVIASGDTTLNLQLQTPNGKELGLVKKIPLRLAVISPLTTWFTTGLALILLLTAVMQSWRRVKRRRAHG